MSRTNPMGLPVAAPNDTQPDAPLPRSTSPGLAPVAVNAVEPPTVGGAVPEAVLDGLDDAFDGRPRVRVVETAETHGENGARYAAVATAVARERVKTEPNAKILVASTTVPVEPADGHELARAARERLDAIIENEQARQRRRAPTAVSTHEKKRRGVIVGLGLLAAAIVLLLVVAGIVIGRSNGVAPAGSGVATSTSMAMPLASTAPEATIAAPSVPSVVAPPVSASAEKPHHKPTTPVVATAPTPAKSADVPTPPPTPPTAPTAPAPTPTPRATNPNVPIF